jgi:PIN domain nuclease of toxin-antitoxin system
MRLLLDTHVLLALLEKQVRTLGHRIEQVIESGEHAIFISVASLWEVAIKHHIGKLPLKASPAHLPELLEDMGLSALVITAEHVLAAVEPEPLTRDPFDRLLLAVCQCENLRLVTVDRALAGHRLALRV